MKDSVRKQSLELYKQGISQSEIARRLKVSRQCIHIYTHPEIYSREFYNKRYAKNEKIRETANRNSRKWQKSKGKKFMKEYGKAYREKRKNII